MGTPAESMLKLDWAERHLDELKKSIDKHVRSDAYTFRSQPKAEPRKYSLMARVSGPCPPAWGCFIGDIVNNARCALDYIIDRLSDLPADSKARRSICFPIYDNPKDFDDGRPKRLNRVDATLIPVIEDLQPYKGRSDNYPLAILQSISNGDKHRAIRTVSATGRFDGFGFGGEFGASHVRDPREAIIQLGPGAVFDWGDGLVYEGPRVDIEIGEQETEVAQFSVPPNTNVNLHPKIVPTIKFAVGQEGIGGLEVLPTLSVMLRRVRDVVGKFP